MKLHFTAVVASVLLLVSTLTLPGCSSAQVRDTTIAEIQRLDERLDSVDQVLSALEGFASDDSPLSILPENIEQLIGRLLPEAETIGDVRSTLGDARGELIAGRERAIDRLTQIDDADSGLSSGLTAGGAILELVSPLLGPYGALTAAVGGVLAAVGRAFGVRSGARQVAQNIEQAKAASPDFKAAMASGPAHDVMRSGLNALPASIRNAVNQVKTPSAA